MNLSTLIPRHAQYCPAQLTVILETNTPSVPHPIVTSLHATCIIRKIDSKKS